MTNSLQIRETQEVDAYQPAEILKQVELIQSVMKTAMKEGSHFGVVPGCGDKPTLLKPGAEKLLFLFKLGTKIDEESTDLARGHREYKVKVTVFRHGTDQVIGQGIGVCSTMEGKYRFRVGPKEMTGNPVPAGYWDIRKTDPAKAQNMIGGKGFSVGKNDRGQWEICRQGEKVEHDNPADYYNTVVKMAKKRAMVDAALTATAASDLFTQDIEDIQENLEQYQDKGDQQERPKQSAHAQQQHTQEPSNDPEASFDNASASPSAGMGWRSVEVPYGKQKGIPLGSLKQDSLQWWIKNFEPKQKRDGTFFEDGVAFRKALNEAEEELFPKAEPQNA